MWKRLNGIGSLILSGVICVQANAATLNIYFPPFDYDRDPQKMIDARSMQLNLQVHRGLFRFLPDGEIRGDLAASWQLSDDHRSLIVKLKKAVFSDGHPITANHVVLSIARMFLIGASMAADLNGIEGSASLKTTRDLKKFGVRSIDKETVEFRLSRANGIFVKQLAAVDCAVLPIVDQAQLIGRLDWNQAVGAGPYKVSAVSKTDIVLTRWRADALDSKSPPTEVRVHLTGESDHRKLIDDVHSDSLDQLIVTPDLNKQLIKRGWHQSVTDMTREHFLVLNPNRFPLEFRRTLAGRIDPQEFATSMGAGFSPAYGFVPPVLAGSIEKVSPAPEGGDIKSDRKIEVLLPNVWEHRKQIETALLSSWKGFDIHFKEVSPSDWNKAKVSKDYDVLINARGIDYPDGISILNYFRSGVDGNFYFIDDRVVDSLLDQAASELNEPKRIDIYRRIQQVVLEKKIVIPLFFGSQASGLWSQRVKYVPPHPLGYHFLPFEMIEMR